MKIFKLNIVIVIILSVLFGCASKDEEAPVITSVKVDGNIVTIEASDNVGVTSYISVGNLRQPSLTDENWQESNIITLDDDGTYYVWVKDASGNISEYDEAIEMSNNLTQRFDHLNWLTPAEGTRVVDGVTYNLAELKAEYGDLYRLVEPLTNEEIERRFKYLAEFMELQMEESIKCDCYNWSLYSGLLIDNNIDPIIGDLMYPLHSKIMNSKDDFLDKFKGIYKYISTTNRYLIVYSSSFNSQKGALGVGTDILDKVSFTDKNLFVRDFMMRYEIDLNAYKQLGLEPEYVIENWD